MIWQVEPVESFREVRDFYWQLIDDMAAVNDRIGWKKGVYPSDNFLRESLEKGELYSLREEGHIFGAVILNSASNEGYKGLPWSGKLDARDILVPHALAVSPEMQNRGIGRQLMGHVMEEARKKEKKAIRLDILGTNGQAEALYRSAGFSFVAARKMYYPDTGWTEYKMFERNL